MKKLLLLLILSFFSTQGIAASCPDGSEPTKTVSADGTYYEYKCANDSNNDVSNKTPIDQDSILASKLEKRRTINVFRAWDTPGTLNDVFKYHYGLYWVPNPETPLHTIGIIHLNWHMNYQSSEWDDYDGIEEFILKKDWLHEEEYPTADIIKFWDDDFAEYISDVSHKLVNQNQSDAYGVMLDWWRDEGGVLPSTGLSSAHVKKARTAIAAKLREKLGNNAVILGNVGWDLNTVTTEYINGVFLELYKEPGKERYTAHDIAKMEDSLYFYDKYLQEPRIIAMAPWRVSKMGNSALIPRDAEENIRYAKLFAAMAMVIPENGYILYSDNNWDELDGYDYGHQYYDLYNIDLGKATSKVIEVTKGVAYKKHQNGYIAFNRLGYDVTVDFGDFQSVVPSMEGVFLKEDGMPYEYTCEEGFIPNDGICLDTGLITYRYENGQIKSEESYKDGKLDGKRTTWYENGQIKSEENYKDNRIYGKKTTWHENGQIEKEENYKDQRIDGKKEGKYTTWHENGQIKSEMIFKEGYKEKHTSWYENGQIESERNYKDNRTDGKGTAWHPNGQIKSEKNYKDGKQDGKWTTWYLNGQIKSEENYKDGKLDGKRAFWKKNGQKKSENNYKDGVLIQ